MEEGYRKKKKKREKKEGGEISGGERTYQWNFAALNITKIDFLIIFESHRSKNFSGVTVL